MEIGYKSLMMNKSSCWWTSAALLSSGEVTKQVLLVWGTQPGHLLQDPHSLFLIIQLCEYFFICSISLNVRHNNSDGSPASSTKNLFDTLRWLECRFTCIYSPSWDCFFFRLLSLCVNTNVKWWGTTSFRWTRFFHTYLTSVMCNYWTLHTAEHRLHLQTQLSLPWILTSNLKNFNIPHQPWCSCSPFHNYAAHLLITERAGRVLEFLCLSLSVSLQLIKAPSDWRFQPASSHHYEPPVALWAAPTTGYRTSGDLILPKDSGSIWIIPSRPHTSMTFHISLCSCSLFTQLFWGWISVGTSCEKKWV